MEFQFVRAVCVPGMLYVAMAAGESEIGFTARFTLRTELGSKVDHVLNYRSCSDIQLGVATDVLNRLLPNGP